MREKERKSFIIRIPVLIVICLVIIHAISFIVYILNRAISSITCQSDNLASLCFEMTLFDILNLFYIPTIWKYVLITIGLIVVVIIVVMIIVKLIKYIKDQKLTDHQKLK